VYESHTPYEWLVQRCLMIVDPWGDDRDDLRAAINTVASTPTQDAGELQDVLIGYVKINEQSKQAGPAQMRAMLEGK